MASSPCANEPQPAPSAQEAPAVLDIEASGFGRGSYPIEVGFVLGNGEARCMLIQPAAHWTHWDPAAQRLHHITREDLQLQGHPIRDVVEVLNDSLCGRTVFSDGWVHDYSWLAVLYDAAHRVPTFRLESLGALLTQDEIERWPVTKQLIANELALPRHRACADARLLQATFRKLRSP
jgi:hypothetical protein